MSEVAAEMGSTEAAEGRDAGLGANEAPEASQDAQQITDAAESYRDGIKDPKARAFFDRYSTIDAAANALLEKEQMLSKRVAMPGEDASEEDMARFRKVMGVLDSVEGYDVTAMKPADYTDEQWQGEAMQSVLSPVLSAAHAAGVNQSGLKAVVDAYFGVSAAASAEQQRQDAAWLDAAEEQLRKDWGSDYKANMAAAEQAVQSVPGITDLVLKDGSQLGNNPSFIRIAADLGRLRGSDNKTVHQFLSAEQGQDLRATHAELTRKMYDAQQAGNRDEAKKYGEQRRRVSEQINGTKSIRG